MIIVLHSQNVYFFIYLYNWKEIAYQLISIRISRKVRPHISHIILQLLYHLYLLMLLVAMFVRLIEMMYCTGIVAVEDYKDCWCWVITVGWWTIIHIWGYLGEQEEKWFWYCYVFPVYNELPHCVPLEIVSKAISGEWLIVLSVESSGKLFWNQ